MSNEERQNANKQDGKQDIRVLIVDDHPAICDALRETIDSKLGMTVVGEVASAGEALGLIRKLSPTVCTVDLSLEDGHGLDLVQNIRVQFPEVHVVVFSMYDENVYAERAMRAGASAYLMKSEPTQSVAEAIRQVVMGEVYLSHRMASRILSKVARGHSTAPKFPVDEFTDREMAVFQMLGEGYTVEDISDRLSLSRKTVETYRRRAKEKLGFETVSELLQFAVPTRIGTGPARSRCRRASG